MTFTSRLIVFGNAFLAANLAIAMYGAAAYAQSALGLQTPPANATVTADPIYSDAQERQRVMQCMTVPIDQLPSNAACVQTLAKINITTGDIKTIRDCRALPAQQEMRDDACLALNSRHPEIELLPH